MAVEELKQILLTHGQRYPAMEPVDAVKLIYQNEFGGGHLIRDERAFLAYLQREYESVTHDPQHPLLEPLGNGIVRVHLAALGEEYILEQLGQAFIRSAAAHRGSLESFQRKLQLLRCLTEQGCFAFTPQALESYLEEYRIAGYPAVSHSQAYRACYRPAYRIVLRSLLPDTIR
jgi:hypothetical protein